MINRWIVIGLLVEILFFNGCGIAEYKAIQQTVSGEVMEDTAAEDGILGDTSDGNRTDGTVRLWAEPDEPEIMYFTDANGKKHEVEVNPNVKKHAYQTDLFHMEDGKMIYEDAAYYARWGIDVSEYQGDIDWNRVWEAGVGFAFIRLGYRGYGEGNIRLDQTYKQNIENAQAAGIDIGVYFFSQAINEKEAEEEADFVLKHLKGYELRLPVVYDPERIGTAEARTDSVSGEQFTKNTKVFCEKLKQAGYRVMVYSNMAWEAYEYDLEQLAEYPIWYADYAARPQTPYNFEYWQYSSEGTVPGIVGKTDLDIQMVSK